MSHKLFVTAKSLKPVGFLGWPDLALALIQKYKGKILLTEDSPTKESIKHLLEAKGVAPAEDDFVTAIDFDDPELILLALEPATLALPQIAGKSFGALCGPIEQDWKEQILACRSGNANGIISEILPDEMPAGLSSDDLEYFCRNSLYLPPCITSPGESKTQNEGSTLIVYGDVDNPSDERLSTLIKYLPVLQDFDQFRFVRHSDGTDYEEICETFGNYEAIYSLLHYPQFGLFCKIASNNQKLLNPKNTHESPLRNFLCDFQGEEPSLGHENRKQSIRAQILQILGKGFPPSPACAREILSQFSTDSLLPPLEEKLELSEPQGKGSRLASIHQAISWEKLLHFKVQRKGFPFVSISTDRLIESASLLHPAGISSLEAILETEPIASEKAFVNPAFARQVLELPNAASVTSLFNALMRVNPSKWWQACDNATTSVHALRLGELLYHSCLMTKDENVRNENLKVAGTFCDKLIAGDLEFALKGHIWKAKLSLLDQKNNLDKNSFSGMEKQFPNLALAACDASQQELILPSYRDNAQDFLKQFVDLFPDSLKEFNDNKHSPLLPCALGETTKAFELTQKLVSEGKTSFKYILHYLLLSYFSTNKSEPILSAMDQMESEVLDFRPFDLHTRFYKIVLFTLCGKPEAVIETFKEMIEEKQHVSKLAPLFTTFPLGLVVLAKALQSSEIEENAMKIGNNLFFDYLNYQDFGEVNPFPEKSRGELTEIISIFISD
ncbi:hypothetical protein OAK38_00270 [Verrucomicrobia bacterium]|nr:hypothetical protein [Verrucomicrobiota bacterium]